MLFLCLVLFSLKTPVVENGLKPKGKPQQLTFIKDLRLDQSRGDDYLWPALDTKVAVNSKGHMLVADQKGNRILQYGVDGAVIRKIGSEGEGPGQFKGLRTVSVLADDRIVAFQTQMGTSHFSLFDQEGQFISRQTNRGLSKLLLTAEVSPNQRHVASAFMNIVPEKRRMTLFNVVLEKEKLEPVLQLSSMEQPAYDAARIGEGAYWSERLGYELKAMLVHRAMATFDTSSQVYTAHVSKYEVTIHDPDLKPKLIVRKQYKPVPLTEAESDAMIAPLLDAVVDRMPPEVQAVFTPAVAKKAVENAALPAGMNPIFGIIPMTEGRFLVISRLSYVTTEAGADIFSAKGELLGSCSFPNNGMINVNNVYYTRMVFRGAYAYTIEDDNGENVLTRYKVQLK